MLRGSKVSNRKVEKFKYTSAPWKWSVIDYSTILLHGPNDEDWVLTISPCEGCQKTTKKNEENRIDWQWGICTTPQFNNSRLIQAAPEMYEALLKCSEHLIVERYDGRFICMACEATKADIKIRHKKNCWYNAILQKVVSK